MKKSGLWILGGCGALLGGCCVASGVAVLFRMEEAAQFEPAGVACEGQAVPGAAPRVEGTPARVLAFGRGSGYWAWESALPVQWEAAESPQDAGVVVCLEDAVSLEVERCGYEDEFFVRRVQQVRQARLVDPSTGGTLHTALVPGPAPEPCPDEITAHDVNGLNISRRERTQSGGDPQPDALDFAFGSMVRGGKPPPVPGLEAPWTTVGLPMLEALLIEQDQTSVRLAFVETDLARVREQVHTWFAAGGWTVGETVDLASLREAGVDDVVDELEAHSQELMMSELHRGDIHMTILYVAGPQSLVAELQRR